MMKYLKCYQCVLVFAVFLSFFVSCKKDKPVDPRPTHRTSDQLLKDSVYYYYKLYSLWSDSTIPDDKSIHSFTDAYESHSDVLNALKGTTPFHAGYRGSIDRFSYLSDHVGGNGLQSSLRMDASTGFGLFVSIGAVTDDTAYPIVYFVEGGSPAALAGITRSDVIVSIDDHPDFAIPVTCGAGGCRIADENVHQTVINRLLNGMEQSSMRIKIRRTDNSETTVTISNRSYEIDPIVKDEVFSYPAKNIGYLALSSFEETPEGHINRQQLNQVFENFEQHQIKDLIVDLRYNTGGYVSTAEYIANKMISANGDGALMYEYVLNPYLSQFPNYPGGFFEDVYFKRDNNLGLNTVYFLVTDITASASEMLINVLRPYMNVVIIAERDGTFGKPVGFFKQEIMGQADLWTASFKLVNARGDTDYWDGIGADHRNVTDYIFRDFGDVEEAMLSTAIHQSLGGSPTGLEKRSFRSVQPKKGRIMNVNSVPHREMVK